MARTKTLQVDRFNLIWALLLWEGEISNWRLRELLCIETVMVSRLLAAFQEAYPQSTVWDRSKRAYYPTGVLPEAFAPPGLNEYLAFLRQAPDSSPWIEEVPDLTPRPEPKIFAAIQSACSTKRAIDVTYSSMAAPSGGKRTIFPHALARVGDRWIVRSWCCRRLGYVDLMLDRFISAKSSDAVNRDLPRDELWEDRVELRLKVHEKLPQDFAKLVCRYRFNGAASARRHVRKALVPYVLQNLRATLDPHRDIPPAFELQVINREEIAPFQFPPLGAATSFPAVA